MCLFRFTFCISWFSLDHFIPVLPAFVVLDSVSSVRSRYVKSWFFQNPDIRRCNQDKIRISSSSSTHPCEDSMHSQSECGLVINSAMTCWHLSSCHRACEDTLPAAGHEERHCPHRLPVTSSPPSYLAQFDAVSRRSHVIREVWHIKLSSCPPSW